MGTTVRTHRMLDLIVALVVTAILGAMACGTATLPSRVQAKRTRR